MADNFTPGETISVSASTAGGSASFSLAQSANYPDCLVTNAGTLVAFVGFGSGQPSLPGAGVANATPLLPGDAMVLRKGSVTQCSAITATGNTTLYFTAGEGS